MAYNEDTFLIICSFLKPVELVKSRRISHHHNIWVKKFLLRHYGTVHINKYLCPMCGDLYETYDDELINRKYIYGHIKTLPESLEDYIGFDYEYSYADIINRYETIDNLFQNKNYKRTKILCEKCSLEDFEFDCINFNTPYLIEVNKNKKLKKNFRYTGDREFFLFIVPSSLISWAILFYEDYSTAYWNEIRATIPTLPYFKL